MTDAEPATQPCGCPVVTTAEHPASCLLKPSGHPTRVDEPRGPGQPNYVVRCLGCGAVIHVASMSRAAADRAAAEHTHSAPGWLKRQHDEDRAVADLAHLASRQDAANYLATAAGWPGGHLDWPLPPTAETLGELFVVADRNRQAGGCDPGVTEQHLRYALSIARAEVHPPAGDQEEREAELMVMVRVRWRGEGNQPKATDVAEVLAHGLPRHLHELADDDPESWAVSTVTGVDLGDLVAHPDD